MNAIKLYDQMEKDFITPALSDNWAKYMGEVEAFLSPNFKERSMGLVCDFTSEVKKVYTAVFPDKSVMQKIIDEGITDAMLFLHHPSIWDIRRSPNVFYEMDLEQLEKFKANRISIYNLHVPLDNYGEYSTSKTLALALGLEIEKPFAKYYGSLCGVICKTNFKDVDELQNKFTSVVGHQTKLYAYRDKIIKDQRVAVVAGGGNDIDVVLELIENDVKVLVSGITLKNEMSTEVHRLEKENGINLLGGTHYSTEKFACQSMCGYFEKLGLESVFVESLPVMEDM